MLIKVYRVVQNSGCEQEGRAGVLFSLMPCVVMNTRNKHPHASFAGFDAGTFLSGNDPWP